MGICTHVAKYGPKVPCESNLSPKEIAILLKLAVSNIVGCAESVDLKERD